MNSDNKLIVRALLLLALINGHLSLNTNFLTLKHSTAYWQGVRVAFFPAFLKSSSTVAKIPNETSNLGKLLTVTKPCVPCYIQGSLFHLSSLNSPYRNLCTPGSCGWTATSRGLGADCCPSRRLGPTEDHCSIFLQRLWIQRQINREIFHATRT